MGKGKGNEILTLVQIFFLCICDSEHGSISVPLCNMLPN